MPTAAKLVAALLLAIVIYLATEAAIPGLPEGTQVGYIREIAAAVGFLTGWLSVGPRPGRDRAEAIAAGLKGVIIATFFVLLFASLDAMYQRTTRMMYDDPLEAALGVFEEMLGFGALLARPGVLGVLIAGGLATGFLTREAARRWR